MLGKEKNTFFLVALSVPLMNYGAAKKIRLPREAIGCSSEETRRKDLASKPYTVAT